MINVHEFVVSTDAAGAGTVLSHSPVRGEIVEVRLPLGGTVLTAGGSADFTLTRVNDGGTVLALANASAPWQYQPRAAAHSTSGGTTAYATGVGPVYDGGVPAESVLRLVVAQAALSQTTAGTVYVYARA